MGIRIYRLATLLAAGLVLVDLVLCLDYTSARPAVFGRYSWAYAAYLAGHLVAAAALAAAALLPAVRVGALLDRLRRGGRFLAPRVAVTAVSMIVLFLIGEGLVRLLGGLGCHPSIDTLATDIEGKPYRTNRRDYRDDDHEPAKPPGVTRIVILGDSVGFGQGVPEPQTWARRLPGELATRGVARVEAINACRIGWDTARELNELRGYGLNYAPDLVLISFVLNDADSWKAPGYYELHRPVPAFVEPALSWSCLYRWVKRRYNVLLVRAGLALSYVEHQTLIFREESGGWQDCRAALREIVDLSRARGAKVACAVWPLFTDERPYPMAAAHALVARTLQGWSVDVLDLEPVLSRYPAETLKVLGDEDPHPSAKACAVAAEALAGFLVQRGLVPAGR